MVFALLLFGCADDGSQCEQLSEPRHYEARVLCEADAELALKSDTALRSDHPMVEARCVPVSSGANIVLGPSDPGERETVASIRLALSQPRPR